MPRHPSIPDRPPERLHHQSNYVLPLVPMYGPAPWDSKSEVAPRAACERCGGHVLSHWIVCGGCHRVHPDNQRKLSAERRNDPQADPKPKPKCDAAPKTEKQRRAAAIAEKRAKITARNQKRMADAYRAFKGNPEADAWAEKLGLKAAS